MAGKMMGTRSLIAAYFCIAGKLPWGGSRGLAMQDGAWSNDQAPRGSVGQASPSLLRTLRSTNAPLMHVEPFGRLTSPFGSSVLSRAQKALHGSGASVRVFGLIRGSAACSFPVHFPPWQPPRPELVGSALVLVEAQRTVDHNSSSVQERPLW